MMVVGLVVHRSKVATPPVVGIRISPVALAWCNLVGRDNTPFRMEGLRTQLLVYRLMGFLLASSTV